MNITLQEEASRLYVVGNSFPIKDKIKSAGGHWDADRKQWWVGKVKRQEIEAAIASIPASAPAVPGPAAPYDGEVRGKAEYKGREYYVRWQGRTSRGNEAFRLVTLDGKIDFWADAQLCRWTKTYQEREFRGRSQGYPTLSGIRRFVEERKAEQKDGVPRTRQALQETLEALDDADDFQGAAAFAREHGLAY